MSTSNQPQWRDDTFAVPEMDCPDEMAVVERALSTVDGIA